jgi:uroporphyrinogen-III synthase
VDVIEIPFIEIRKPRSYQLLDNGLKNIAKYEWLILTSVNGVEALSTRMKHLGTKPAKLAHLQVAAIGPATAEEIVELGLNVAVVPERYIAESVIESLRGEVKGKRVLLVRAKVARDVIPGELRKMGAKVDVVEAYETVVPPSSKRRLQSVMKDPMLRPHIVCFTSSSTVRNFVALLGPEQRPSRRRPGETVGNSAALKRRVKVIGINPPETAESPPLPQALAGMRFASIGPVTSATLREVGCSVHIEATEYTIPGLIQSIKEKL